MQPHRYGRGIVNGPLRITAYSEIELSQRIEDNEKRGYKVIKMANQTQYVGRATRRVYMAYMTKEDNNGQASSAK